MSNNNPALSICPVCQERKAYGEQRVIEYKGRQFRVIVPKCDCGWRMTDEEAVLYARNIFDLDLERNVCPVCNQPIETEIGRSNLALLNDIIENLNKLRRK